MQIFFLCRSVSFDDILRYHSICRELLYKGAHYVFRSGALGLGCGPRAVKIERQGLAIAFERFWDRERSVIMLRLVPRRVDFATDVHTRVCSCPNLEYRGSTALRSDQSFSIACIRYLEETTTQYLPAPRYTLFYAIVFMVLQTTTTGF